MAKDLLKALHITPASSLTTVAEAFRIPNPTERARRMGIITQLVQRYEATPAPFLTSEEVFRQVRVYRPAWLKSVDRHDKVAYLEGFRFPELWKRLKADPSWLPPRTGTIPLFDVIGRAMKAQSKAKGTWFDQNLQFGFRDAELARRLGPVVSARSTAENFWRRQACVAMWKALMGEGVHPDDTAWWQFHLDASRVTRPEWVSFWLAETQPRALKRTRAIGLAEYLQIQEKIEPGNVGDIAHLPYLFDADAFFTSDRRLYNIVERLHTTYCPEVALPVLLVGASEGLEDPLRAAVMSARQGLDGPRGSLRV